MRIITPHVTIAIALFAGLLALFVRWHFATHAQVMQPLYRDYFWGDAGQYYRYAWNLLHHDMFSSAAPGQSDPVADSFRDPGYPAFLALCMGMTNSYDQWYALVIFCQVALGALTVTCSVLAVRDAIPAALLVVAAAAMALWPHLVSIPAYVLSESLTAALCSVTALALRQATVRRSMAYTVLAAACLSMAALTNAVLGPLVLLVTLAFAWKRTMTHRQLLVFVVVSSIPLFAWGVRNANLTATLSPSMRAEINLVQGSWPTYHLASQLAAENDPVGIQTIDAINLEIATLHIDRAQGLKAIMSRMIRAPGSYIVWYLSKPALLWGWEIGLGSGDIYMYPTRNSPFIVNPILKGVEAAAYVFNGVLALLALAGLIVAIVRRAPSPGMLFFGIVVAWVTVVYGVLQSDARYSTPYRPAEIALACFALAAAIARVRRQTALHPTPN